MNKIPEMLREEIASDPFYQRCCITGVMAKDTKVEWHHNLIYAGKQVQEKWCILPLTERIHYDISLWKEKCDWIMLNRADDETLERFSRAENLRAKRDRLNKKYGTPRH